MSVIGFKILRGINEYNTGNESYSDLKESIAFESTDDHKNRIDFEALHKINEDGFNTTILF